MVIDYLDFKSIRNITSLYPHCDNHREKIQCYETRCMVKDKAGNY